MLREQVLHQGEIVKKHEGDHVRASGHGHDAVVPMGSRAEILGKAAERKKFPLLGRKTHTDHADVGINVDK